MCGRYYLDEQLKYDLTKWVIISDGHIFPYGDIHPGEEGFDSNNISVWGTKVFDSPIFNFTLLNSNGGA